MPFTATTHILQVGNKNAAWFLQSSCVTEGCLLNKTEYSKQDIYHLFQEVLCIQHHFCLQEQLGLLREMLWSPPK